MGVEVRVENLTKRFGKQTIWEDVSLTLPAGEISVLLGPSGTGKSVFLKHLVGLLKPNAGHIWIDGHDVCNISESRLYEVRKLFGVLFQDGALFGSQNLFDNIAFPLREHTKKGEAEIKKIVLEKMNLVGLSGAESKLPGEISGGMRKRAGLARALVLDPQILLFDEPDSGLDPVRTSYLDQLIVDLNAQTGATCLIVTHNINTARTVPDNIGLLYRRHLAMFGPRNKLLTSEEPVVLQFMNGRKQGPIGMSEEKDAAELAAEAEDGGPERRAAPYRAADAAVVAAGTPIDGLPARQPRLPARPDAPGGDPLRLGLRRERPRALGRTPGPLDERRGVPQAVRSGSEPRPPRPSRPGPTCSPAGPRRRPSSSVAPPAAVRRRRCARRPSPDGPSRARLPNAPGPTPTAAARPPRPTPFPGPPSGVATASRPTAIRLPAASMTMPRSPRKGVLAGWRASLTSRGDRE